MPNYTPTTDVFRTFIDALKMGKQMQQDEVARAKEKVEDQYKADANLRANAVANQQMGVLSGGAFPTVQSYGEGLKNIAQQLPQAVTPQDVVPFDPAQLGSKPQAYNRPYAPEAEVQQYMKDIGGMDALAHPERTVVSTTDAFGNVTYQPTAKGIGAPKTTIAPGNKGSSVGGAGGAELTPEAQQMIGQTIVDSGSIPPGLARSSKMAAEAYNKAAEIIKMQGKVDSLAEKNMQYVAAKAGRTAAGRQATLSGAFEDTAKDIYTQIALPIATKVDAQGNDVFSRWRRAKINKEVLGDKDMRNLDVAVNNIMLDYSKVQLGAAASASELSVGAQERTKELLDSSESLDAFKSRMENVIIPDMALRQRNLQIAAGLGGTKKETKSASSGMSKEDFNAWKKKKK